MKHITVTRSWTHDLSDVWTVVTDSETRTYADPIKAIQWAKNKIVPRMPDDHSDPDGPNDVLLVGVKGREMTVRWDECGKDVRIKSDKHGRILSPTLKVLQDAVDLLGDIEDSNGPSTRRKQQAIDARSALLSLLCAW